VTRELVGEPALADPGFPGQEDEAAATDQGVVERCEQLRELALATHEDPLEDAAGSSGGASDIVGVGRGFDPVQSSLLRGGP
jgi:hypothetical protein